MDVPYDPACPLLIDSDEESIEDEILGKKSQQKHVSRIDFGLDMQLKASSKPKEKTDTKFVPAFEDDNEELLTYCLRESGFLSDDDGDATTDINKDKNADEISKNEEKKHGVDDKKYKKKKKKDKKKEIATYRKEKSARELSSDKDLSNDKKDNSEKLDSKKSHKGGNKKVEKSFEVTKQTKVTKDKKKSRRSSSSLNESENSFRAGSDDDDDIDMIVVKELEEDLADFPLSKTVDGGLENKEKTPRSSRSKSKDGKNIKESSNNRHEKNESRENDEKHRSKEKAKKRKRKRSKSSHKRSQSPDAEPENKKKRKNRHREKSKERSSVKKDEERKDEHLKHKKKHKHHSDEDDPERKERKHKKKDNSKKLEESEPRSKEKDDTQRKSSSSSHNPHKRHHSDRSHSEKSKQKEVDLKMKSKSEPNKRERRHSDHKREKHHSEKSEKKDNNKREGQDNKKEHTRHKGTGPQTFDSKGSKEKFNLDIEDGRKKVIEKAKIKKEVDISKKSENLKLQKEEEVKDELDGSDTDSEFERLSDIEREVEKEDSAPEDSAFDKGFENQKSSIGNDKDSVAKPQDFVDQNVSKEGPDSEQAKEQNEMSKENSADAVEVKVNEKDAINNVSEKDVIERTSKTVNDDKSEQEVSESVVSKQEAVKLNQEKRPFKLFSKEETKKLKQELLVKSGAIDHEKMIDEDVKEEVTKKMECENENEAEFEKVESEEPPKSEKEKVDERQVEKDQEEVGDDGKATKNLQKSKDDLFDDIFAQEDDSENRENDGLAKMLGKDEETSPKRLSFKKQIPLQEKKEVVPNNEKGEEKPARKTPKLKLEDGKLDGKKGESPKDKKLRSPREMVIPGLEPISIPGLELSSIKEKVSEKEEVKKSPSKIPLLFDDEAPAQKLGIPKTPEFSPPKEKAVKRKQPYTPPEEFSGMGNEAEINQTDRYYHLEADDSPYNPEDLTLMDIGLSPVDAKNLQQDALKGAVELRLKEPFSGYENPTWQKIIEAKSRHEVKRQSRKGHDKHKIKGFAKPQSSKQQKMVDMLVRQSRVEQECKEVLKLYYKSKEITKEEYKSILRKAVPQVTMSNSPIIPEKIRSLMKKFVCKSKGQRLMAGSEKRDKSKSKTRSSSSQSFSHSLTFPGEKRFRYLNPDLPMPPL